MSRVNITRAWTASVNKISILRFSDSGENWNMMSLSCFFPPKGSEVRYRVPWGKGRGDQKYPSITSGPSAHAAVRMIGQENYRRNNSECVRLSHPKSLLTHILYRCGCIREPVKAMSFRLLAVDLPRSLSFGWQRVFLGKAYCTITQGLICQVNIFAMAAGNDCQPPRLWSHHARAKRGEVEAKHSEKERVIVSQ